MNTSMTVWIDAAGNVLCEARAQDTIAVKTKVDPEGSLRHAVTATVEVELPDELKAALVKVLESKKETLADNLKMDQITHAGFVQSRGNRPSPPVHLVAPKG